MRFFVLFCFFLEEEDSVLYPSVVIELPAIDMNSMR